MRISRERLLSEAATTGFRPEILEKVAHLLHLLETLQTHPVLKGNLALKGGTALNLFMLSVPRLSVDIDLNYTGEADREAMLAQRPRVEEAVEAVCSREGLSLRRTPTQHAGGKWFLRYESALGQGGNLEVDLNFVLRVPLWPVVAADSLPVGSYMARRIPLLDIHELAAGKLVALLARNESRDLFDARQILSGGDLNPSHLRLAFVVHGAMNRRDWRTVSVDDVRCDATEIQNSLVPVMRVGPPADLATWANQLVEECRRGLESVLPLRDAEMEFLNRVLDDGEIDPALLTSDTEMIERIRRQPMLHWKARHVREHRSARRGSS